MSRSRITLLGSQHECLTKYLESDPKGHERAAVVLFRRLHITVDGLADSDRYIAQEIIIFKEKWIIESSPTSIDFKLAPFRNLFRRCKEEGLVFGFIHNHPTGNEKFSKKDDQNEITILRALSNRNGIEVSFVALLWSNKQWLGRTRSAKNLEVSEPVRHTIVVGNKIDLYGYAESSDEHTKVHERQAAAFGQPFVDMLQSLRVAVVGTGGTGSPFSTLAARAGLGELVLIDKDPLEANNLNRVRGLMKSDTGQIKSKTLKEFIEKIGLSVDVGSIASDIDTDPVAVDALASCDIIIGCTDDFCGRELMNIALYCYAQPYIDIGLGGKIDEGADDQPFLRYHYGRISTIFPENGQCLFCQGVIKDIWIRTQQARRDNPDITYKELKDRYLQDGNTDAPGVGPFTNAIADFALATLFDLLKPFRNYPPEVRQDMFLVDFVKMKINSHDTNGVPDCQYCCKQEFLLLNEQYRLNRPFLERRDVYY